MSNIAVKLADFGLSHVREINSDASKGILGNMEIIYPSLFKFKCRNY
jgi:hypothetical protein